MAPWFALLTPPASTFDPLQALGFLPVSGQLNDSLTAASVRTRMARQPRAGPGPSHRAPWCVRE